MNRKSLKQKNIFKSAAFGAALVLCGSFVPVGAIQTLAADWNQSSNPSKTDGQIAQNTNRIEVDASGVETTVAKGGKFTIPAGLYYGGSTTAHLIGTASSEGITSSKVVARYSGGAVVYDSSTQEGGFQTGVQFDADRVGRYEIEYSVTDGGVTYTYTLELNCVVEDVTFTFDTNDKNIVPSVYDLSLSKANGSYKDIVLPIPTITDEKGNEIDDVPVHIDGEEPTEDEYMTITLDQGYSDDVKVARTSDGKYYIDGDSLSEANGSTFNIVYTFYQNGAPIASTTKSFTVDDSYYTDSNGNPGYTLKISRASSQPSSADVKVKVALPSINATTSASDTPSSESVTVSYVINVDRMENGNVVETIEDAIDEDFNFTAPKNGDYRIEYVATDFYGHTATNSFTITDVRDTRSATPYIYDAGDENAKNEDGSYKSALNYVKSKTENRNIVIFAIGGHDYAVDEGELNLYREIRSGTNSNVILYDIQGYDHYNLIFNAKADSDKSIYRAIYDDNAYIRNQMILGGVVATDDDTIKNWLKAHKYLIVTDGEKDPITGEAFAFAEGEAPTTEEEWSALGYACIEPSSNQDFAVQTYNVYYYADDKVKNNNAGMLDYSFEIVTNADDSAVPTIQYPTELQNSYLGDDIITLTAPTASDEGGDSNVELHTAYRYLDSSRQPITTVGEEIRYVINDASKRNIPSDRWYIQADGNNVVSSSGWTILEGEDEYEIDLSDKPEGAAYIEFFSYAIDDQGNVAFYAQQSYVSNIEDSVAPFLYSVVSAPEVDGGYINDKTIVLPTLTYKDNLPQYMTSAVVVYRVDRDTQEQFVVHSSGMNSMPNAGTGDYVLMAGSFTPSVGGTYIAAVTVTDAGNHSVTTYFAYEVEEIPVVEDPEITNIGQDSKEIVVGQPERLDPPKISVSESAEIGYIGFNAYSSENIANDYIISVVEADNNEYVLDQGTGYFTANASGTYTLEYTAFVISYSTKEEYFSTVEGGENGKLFLTKDSEGQDVLAYKADGTENLVGEGQATAGETYLITRTGSNGQYKLSANTNPTGFDGKELDLTSLPQYSNGESVVELHKTENETENNRITFISGEVAVNLYMDDTVYPKTQYGDLSSEVLIKELDGDVAGAGKKDLENSNVKISFVETGGTTRIIDTISLADWTVSDDNAYLRQDGRNIYLKLNRNGRYTITYTLKAVDHMGMSVGSEQTKSYTLSVGDVRAPELTIDNANNQFIAARYNVGDTVDIRIADESLVTVNDPGGSSREELLKNLTITVRNTSTNSSAVTLSNQSDVEGQYAYSYTIEEEGTYQISISVRDAAGNTSQTSTFTFTVGGESTDPVNVTEIVGKVLIGVAAVILAGVVVYFIVSKVKESKGKKTK